MKVPRLMYTLSPPRVRLLYKPVNVTTKYLKLPTVPSLSPASSYSDVKLISLRQVKLYEARRRRRHKVSAKRALKLVTWNSILHEADRYRQFHTPFVILAPNVLCNTAVRFAPKNLKQLRVSRNDVVNVYQIRLKTQFSQRR